MTEDKFKSILATAFAEQEERLDKKLDEKLDSQFSEFEVRLERRLEEQFTARFEEQRVQLTRYIDMQFATIFSQLTQHTDQRIKEVHGRLDVQDERIDGIRITVDGIAKRLEIDSDEQAVINHRHERWIGQLAKNTDTKLATS